MHPISKLNKYFRMLLKTILKSQQKTKTIIKNNRMIINKMMNIKMKVLSNILLMALMIKKVEQVFVLNLIGVIKLT